MCSLQMVKKLSSIGSVVALAIAGSCVLLAAPLALTVTAAANPIPVSHNVSSAKYVLVANSESDFVSLRRDLQNIGAEILEEFSSVFHGAGVLMSVEQAQALQNDPRVSAINPDQILSIAERTLTNTDATPLIGLASCVGSSVNDNLSCATVPNNTSGSNLSSSTLATMETVEAETLPIAAPGPPTNIVAIGGTNSATVSWSAPLSNGGSTITSYIATSSPGDYICTTSSLSCTIVGLSNFVAYTFTLTAQNSAGPSLPSVASNSVILGYQNDNLSDAVGIAAGTTYSNNSAATIETGEPIHAGVPGGKSMWFRYSSPTLKLVKLDTHGSDFDTVVAVYRSSVIELSVSGLQVVGDNDNHPSGLNGSSAVSFVAKPGVIYYIAVAGSGMASGAITLTAAIETILVPSSPTSVKAASLNGRASVSWRKPDTNSSTITNYRVTSKPDGRTCNVGPGVFFCSISGLTNGRSYTFSVVATNPAGNSVSSSPSNSVIPSSLETVRRIAPVWGMDRIDQRTSSDDGYLYTPGRGKGTRIYVVDTGVRKTHSEFGSRVSAGYGNVDDGRGTDDCNGHGSHVSSIAAGSSYGVANLATIVPVRVLDCNGSGSDSQVIDGLDWIYQNIISTNSQAVVNMSLGGSYSQQLEVAVEKIIQLGVPVVVAAGNSAIDACDLSPAGVQKAITVGASTSTNRQAAYSNYGSCVDVFAPGSSITAAGISGKTSTSVKSGSSMAAPHVAGYAAVVKGLFPRASADAVTSAITQSASSNVLTTVSVGTANSLLYVALPKCEVAVRAGIPCSSFVITANTPATFAKIAQIANLYVSASAKVTVSVLNSSMQYCRVVDGKIVAVKTGTCGVVVTVATSSKTRTSRVFIAVKK